MISGVILAAGSSKRMGRPKQLLPWKGKPLLEHVIDAAAASGLDEIVVVLGHRADEIREAITLPERSRVVVNEDFDSGQASSLRAGLEALDAESEAAVILLGDQPGVTPASVAAVLEGWRSAGTPAARALYAGAGHGDAPGHPVVLAREIWAEVVSPGRDEGAGPAMARHPEWLTTVPLPGPPPVEVDTPEDYQELVGG